MLILKRFVFVRENYSKMKRESLRRDLVDFQIEERENRDSELINQFFFLLLFWKRKGIEERAIRLIQLTG